VGLWLLTITLLLGALNSSGVSANRTSLQSASVNTALVASTGGKESVTVYYPSFRFIGVAKNPIDIFCSICFEFSFLFQNRSINIAFAHTPKEPVKAQLSFLQKIPAAPEENSFS